MLDLCPPSQPLPPSSAAVLSSGFSQPPHEGPERSLSTGHEPSPQAGTLATHPPLLVHSFPSLPQSALGLTGAQPPEEEPFGPQNRDSQGPQ